MREDTSLYPRIFFLLRINILGFHSAIQDAYKRNGVKKDQSWVLEFCTDNNYLRGHHQWSYMFAISEDSSESAEKIRRSGQTEELQLTSISIYPLFLFIYLFKINLINLCVPYNLDPIYSINSLRYNLIM